MKRNFFLFFLVTLLHLYPKAQAVSSYSIYTPADFPKEILSDYIKLLNDATNKPWQSVSHEKEVKSGIILKIISDRSFTSKENFLLQSNGNSLLTISSTSNAGLWFGMYKHLRSLGFKFYLPDELYTITPLLTNPFGPKKRYYRQAFPADPKFRRYRWIWNSKS